MSMEMEAISFYGTLGAIILLQISFYWLFRDDHYKRQMTQDEIGQQRLVILLAGPSETFSAQPRGEPNDDEEDDDGGGGGGGGGGECFLLRRRRLEQIGFVIYELRLDEQVKQLSFNRAHRVIRMAASKQDHIDRAVALIDRELKLNDQKVHAFVDLGRPLSRSTRENRSGFRSEEGQQLDPSSEVRHSYGNKLINLIRDDHQLSYQLLSALAPILNQKSRIIQVQVAEVEANKGTTSEQSECLHDDQQSLLSLQLDIEALVNDYLRSEFARLNRGQLIELVFKSQTWPMHKNNHRLQNKDTRREDDNQTEGGQKSISEKCASTSKLFDELQKLLVLVNPRDRVGISEK